MGSTILGCVQRQPAGLCDSCLHQKLIGNTPAEARAYVEAEMARWERILREAGIQPQ